MPQLTLHLMWAAITGVVPVEKVRDTDFVSWASFDNSAQPQQMVGLSLICLSELNLRTLKFFALLPS
jgi:hypothetical protein